MLTNYYLCTMERVGQYIESLLDKGGHKQSDVARAIGVPRQMLSYVIADRRELSMSLALKLESYFNLPEGKLLKMQAQQSVADYKLNRKRELVEHLLKAYAFWSYANIVAEKIPDEELIEKAFIYLGFREIALLFELYHRDFVHKVWRERMAVQGDYLFALNVMIALYYFDIKQPERYLKRVENEHIKQLIANA